jgi:hypothetical protein
VQIAHAEQRRCQVTCHQATCHRDPRHRAGRRRPD